MFSACTFYSAKYYQERAAEGKSLWKEYAMEHLEKPNVFWKKQVLWTSQVQIELLLGGGERAVQTGVGSITSRVLEEIMEPSVKS